MQRGRGTLQWGEMADVVLGRDMRVERLRNEAAGGCGLEGVVWEGRVELDQSRKENLRICSALA